MKEQKKGKCAMQSSGVTLVALILTIIILLILAMTSVALIMRWNIVDKTEMAAEGYQGASEKDAIELGYDEYALDKSIGKENANLTVDGADVTGNAEEGGGWTVKFKNSGNVYTVDENGNIREPARVTVEGEEPVTLTKDNVAKYLGMVVKDFKTGTEGSETKTVGTAETGGEKEVKVSTKYRLYYVDFEGKYGDKGAVYLKADCGGTSCSLLTTDTTSADEPNIKIKDLNPGLYKTEVDTPSIDNNNMKVVTWLLDTKNWESLKEDINETYKDKVNYIVGAPSLEMMMDSYNTHYELKGDTPQADTIDGVTRQKLFYKYPCDGIGKYGYGVGPSDNSSAKAGYSYITSYGTVQTDDKVNTMYYPGNYFEPWLATPSARTTDDVVTLNGDKGGCVFYSYYTNGRTLCPLVCLDSSVPLSLKQGESVPAE